MDAATVLSIVRRVAVDAVRLTWWPIARLINLAILLLRPFYVIIAFALLPFTHLTRAAVRVLSLPFSVKWLEQIETLYVFLGIASLIGCLTGATLFVLFKFLSSTLSIDASIVPDKRAEPLTAAQYRASRRANKEEAARPSSPSPAPIVLKRPAASRRRGLLSQAIIEEEDSDF